MKRKLTAWILCLAMLTALLLTGCAGQKNTAPETTAGTLPAPTTTAAPTTTEAPTTEVPTTEVPTTEVPTTEAPTTEPPATEAETEKESGGSSGSQVTYTATEEERDAFYKMFWELDRDETEAWLAKHPRILSNGYENIMVDESGLNQDGLDIHTTQGHQVLALDAPNGILVVRAYLNRSRAVLVIARYASRLRLCPSASIGSYGERIASICARNGGILAMTGSGFDDPGGNGNGGTVFGQCMCSGRIYGTTLSSSWYRLELLSNNTFIIKRAGSGYNAATTDAMEFQPALLIGGAQQPSPAEWTDNQPRAGIGQNSRGEILMCAVEGRYSDSPGCSVVLLGGLMQQYGGVTAMSTDGGTTAMIWYRGKPLIRCSNPRTPGGRFLPNAWVY